MPNILNISNLKREKYIISNKIPKKKTVSRQVINMYGLLRQKVHFGPCISCSGSVRWCVCLCYYFGIRQSECPGEEQQQETRPGFPVAL